MVVLIPGLAAAQPGRGALADVGGTNNLQNTTFTIHGGRTSDTRLQLDGVRLGNVLSGGEFSNFVPDTGIHAGSRGRLRGSVRRAAVRRSAHRHHPARGRQQRPRRRCSRPAVNSAWQTSNIDEDLQNRGLPDAERDEAGVRHQPVGRRPDPARHACGSTVRRAGRRTRTTSPASTTTRTRATRRSGRYVADTSRRGFFSLEQNGVNLRLTSQLAQKHKVSFYYDNQCAYLGRQPRGRLARVGRGLSLPGPQPGAGRRGRRR